MIKKDHARAEARELSNVVSNNEDGAFLLVDEMVHAVIAFLLECNVADSEYFIDNQDV